MTPIVFNGNKKVFFIYDANIQTLICLDFTHIHSYLRVYEKISFIILSIYHGCSRNRVAMMLRITILKLYNGNPWLLNTVLLHSFRSVAAFIQFSLDPSLVDLSPLGFTIYSEDVLVFWFLPVITCIFGITAVNFRRKRLLGQLSGRRTEVR